MLNRMKYIKMKGAGSQISEALDFIKRIEEFEKKQD